MSRAFSSMVFLIQRTGKKSRFTVTLRSTISTSSSTIVTTFESSSVRQSMLSYAFKSELVTLSGRLTKTSIKRSRSITKRKSPTITIRATVRRSQLSSKTTTTQMWNICVSGWITSLNRKASQRTRSLRPMCGWAGKWKRSFPTSVTQPLAGTNSRTLLSQNLKNHQSSKFCCQKRAGMRLKSADTSYQQRHSSQTSQNDLINWATNLLTKNLNILVLGFWGQ